MTSRTILYVGTLNPGGTCLMRMQTLEKLGHTVIALDTVPGRLAARRATLAWRVRRRLFGYRDESRANARLLALPETPAPDIIWIDKGLTILPATLAALKSRWPGATLLAWYGDDMMNPHNQSPAWLEGLPAYDLHVTSKSFNVPELEALGARDVMYMDKSFSPEVHRPLPVDAADRERLGGPVGFIGWPEGARERSLRALAAAGIPVRIWGPWPKWKSAPNLRIEGRPLWLDDYARAIAAFDVNLGFLRRVNRDRHTHRSVEIPACGGFLLAERTDEHARLFREGVEAEFFASDAELIAKVRHFLTHPEHRNQIAAAGKRRVWEGGFSNDARLAQVVEAALERGAHRLAAA